MTMICQYFGAIYWSGYVVSLIIMMLFYWSDWNGGISITVEDVLGTIVKALLSWLYVLIVMCIAVYVAWTEMKGCVVIKGKKQTEGTKQ